MTKRTIKHTLMCFIILYAQINLIAEGTRELAPNSNILIGQSTTNDIAALHINNDEFNSFASYDNFDETSRLYIHITDPLTESLLLGFSIGHLNTTNQQNQLRDFEYRIKDPNGNIVYGPIRVLTTDSGAGVIEDWDSAFTGPQQLGNVGGYLARDVLSQDLISAGWTAQGDYYIEFRNLNEPDVPFLIDYWDITVVEDQAEKKGRVWSFNWALFAINDFGFPNRPFNGAFYVCAPDQLDPATAYITKIDFNESGFQPAAFNIAFNSFGIVNTGDVINDRKSFEDGNMTSPEYPIFLNDPVDYCETASVGTFSFDGLSGCEVGDFCFDVSTTKPGQINILLDFDGQDGVFTPGTADVVIGQNILASEVGTLVCIPWDGLDGLGQQVQNNSSTDIFLNLSFSQGIYHFPIYDAEFLFNGYRLETVRPAGPQPKLFYDDSNITAPSGVNEPQVQLQGCTLPCHAWSNFNGNQGVIGFGNLNTINSWWFSQETIMDQEVGLPGPTIRNETIELCPGENIVVNGETYSAAGNYVQNLTNVSGCDSTINLMITQGVCDDCIQNENRIEARVEIFKTSEDLYELKVFIGSDTEVIPDINTQKLEPLLMNYLRKSSPRSSENDCKKKCSNIMSTLIEMSEGRTLKSR